MRSFMRFSSEFACFVIAPKGQGRGGGILKIRPPQRARHPDEAYLLLQAPAALSKVAPALKNTEVVAQCGGVGDNRPLTIVGHISAASEFITFEPSSAAFPLLFRNLAKKPGFVPGVAFGLVDPPCPQHPQIPIDTS